MGGTLPRHTGRSGKAFISYRRQGGGEMARLVRDSLQKRGYNVFMDVEDLRSGAFNTALYEEIESATDVVVILTPGSLDRCRTEGDWFRLEVAHAIRKKENIVPVMMRGFEWPREPLPDDLAGLPAYQGLAPSHEFFEASMDKLARLLVGRPRPRRPWMKAAVAATSVLVAAGIILLVVFGRSLFIVDQARRTVENPAAPSEGAPVPAQKSPIPVVPPRAEPPKPPTTPSPSPVRLRVETTSIGMRMILIPVGEFTMGSSDYGVESGNEKPPHKVRITRPFYLGQYEVTVGEFRRFVEESNYNAAIDRAGKGWRNAFPDQTHDHPVVNVSWNDAKAFCDWLSKKEGKKYRLPTEAEWEYACRAGTKTKWSFGDDESRLGDYAWYNANSGGQTHPVGQKKPNPWGLYDMHGNAREWCSDWYAEKYYASSAVDDPEGPSSQTDRTLRGGSWYNDAWAARSSCRYREIPGDLGTNYGFRVARSP